MSKFFRIGRSILFEDKALVGFNIMPGRYGATFFNLENNSLFDCFFTVISLIGLQYNYIVKRVIEQ
jgi:hypothetical protein